MFPLNDKEKNELVAKCDHLKNFKSTTTSSKSVLKKTGLMRLRYLLRMGIKSML